LLQQTFVDKRHLVSVFSVADEIKVGVGVGIEVGMEVGDVSSQEALRGTWWTCWVRQAAKDQTLLSPASVTRGGGSCS